MMRGNCSIDECDIVTVGRGLCNKHWIQFRTSATFFYAPHLSVIERFWARVTKDESGCWIWTGGISDTGYSSFQRASGHRWAYKHFVGPIPEGLHLDHLCRVPACVNPSHLEPVTAAENSARSITATKTHCIHGHPFDEANTHFPRRGGRKCRRCNREREYARRKKSEIIGVRGTAQHQAKWHAPRKQAA